MSDPDLITDFESPEVGKSTHIPISVALQKSIDSILTFLRYAKFAAISEAVQFASGKLQYSYHQMIKK